MLNFTCACSKLQHNHFETIEGVLQYYPRVHRDCQLWMQDGEYATLVGTVTKNKTVHRVSMSIMILEFAVQPGVLASLRGESQASGALPKRLCSLCEALIEMKRLECHIYDLLGRFSITCTPRERGRTG